MRTRQIIKALSILIFAAATGTTGPQPQLDTTSRVMVTGLRKQLLASSKEDDQLLLSEGYLSSRLSQIRTLVRKEILRQLNLGFANANELNERLRPILQQDEWETPTSALTWRANGGHFVVIGYSILHGGAALPDATAVIEAYRTNGDRYEFVAQTGEELENSLLRLEEIPSSSSNELWILAHGQMTGVMQYTEKIRIYSFEGSGFKERWSTTPKLSPEFHLAKDTVEITYGEEWHKHSPLMTQTLAVTNEGLVVEKSLVPKK